ncbi:MAG: LytR/AlgR family response regulator transcription factor [Pyrinomonadaceae bacterium]
MTNSSLIRVLILDDEPLARAKICDLLKDDAEVEIVGGGECGFEALDMIEKTAPDLIFLDIQMPEVDGFAIVEAIEQIGALRGTAAMPVIIFVTAYDKYALRAFDVSALDYLLKPFDRERFEKALARGKDQIKSRRSGETSRQILNLLEGIKEKPVFLERLVIKTGGRVLFIKTEEVDWFEADGNYVCLHTGKQSHLIRGTISNLEAQLDPQRFRRIHRSTIVNMDSIRELQPWFHGEYKVILHSGKDLTLSRNYRSRLHELFSSLS